jgi:hypothetical protein
MIAFAIVAIAVALLLLGTAVGWAVRGPAKWCPRDGDILKCPTCQPHAAYPATGRAAVRQTRPPAATSSAPLMTPLAARRAPDVWRTP